MPTINLTVKPKDVSPAAIFNASQLAVVIKGKKPAINWNDDAEKLVDNLWESVTKIAVAKAVVGGVTTQNMNKRLESAKIVAKTVPPSLGPGNHILMVKVDGDSVPIPVTIAAPADQPEPAREPVDVGLKGIASSEDMARKLEELKRDQAGLATMELKKGDKQHPLDILWKMGDRSGSLPMTTHTKGDGGRNEKAALDEVKRTFKDLGFV
jgi:hypothetical protein